MRAIIFYISLCFLLLSGGSYLYADMHNSSESSPLTQNLKEKLQIKIRNTVPYTNLTESADIDLDEEFHSEDDAIDASANKIAAQNNSLLNNWYLTFSSQNVSKDYSKRIKIFAPFCGYSNPIYIRQQVLRI
ncbi:MAG: hypothetical protein V4572_01155 [Bacteroidota bacterium]